MAIAKICDRCGGVYAKNEFQADFGNAKYGTVKAVVVMFEETNRDQVDLVDRRKNAYMDLCDHCASQLCTFLRDKGAKVAPGTEAIHIFNR